MVLIYGGVLTFQLCMITMIEMQLLLVKIQRWGDSDHRKLIPAGSLWENDSSFNNRYWRNGLK